MMRVAAEGGACTPLSPAGPEEQVARLFPFFLPDDHHFLYTRRTSDAARDGVYVGSLSDPAGRRLLSDVSSALFVPNAAGAREGHLVFIRAPRMLTAQPFDTRSLQLTGEPVVISRDGSLTNTGPQIAAGTDLRGDLVYVAGGWTDQQLIWYARGGKELGREPILSQMLGVRLSPDDKRALVSRGDGGGDLALWLQDSVRHQETRFTPPSLTPAPGGVWSPDGKFLVINTAQPASTLRLKSADGGPDQTLLTNTSRITVSDWSHDGRWLVFTEVSLSAGGDIWLLENPLSAPGAGRKPIPWLQTPARESSGQISPDGKWMAFTSDQSGTPAVYVRPFKVPVDPADPQWRADSKELFFVDFDRPIAAVMGAPIGLGPEPIGTPVPLVEFRRGGNFLPETNGFIYSPTADGQKFLISANVGTVAPSVRLILNWGRMKK
jgi:dipeptidyl aminopeptidase/acylaminoacyl peptidase